MQVNNRGGTAIAELGLYVGHGTVWPSPPTFLPRRATGCGGRTRHTVRANAIAESATSWTAIAESSRPEIRVTSETPASRITRRMTPEKRSDEVQHDVYGDDARSDRPGVVAAVGPAHEHDRRDDRSRPGEQRRAQRHERDVDVRHLGVAGLLARSAARARPGSAAAHPRLAAPATEMPR